MKSVSLDSIALATTDGRVTGLSTHEEKHPLYGTPSFSLRMSVPLNAYEYTSAEEILWSQQDPTGKIRYSIRSWAAQLGLAGFNPECVETRIHGQTLEVETLISDISGADDDILMESLRNNITDSTAFVCRAVLLPDGARTGESHMPLKQNAHYIFDRHRLSPDVLNAVWAGSPGREAIEPIRTDIGVLPEHLNPDQYFVGAVSADTGDECWLIEPELLRGGEKVPVLHDHSCLFDPRRTKGKRQIEIRNINGNPESLEDLVIVASRYQTNLQLFHCAHQSGV